MQAMVIEEFGGPEKYVLRDLPVPEPNKNEIRIKVKAFGINRAEVHMRRGDWGKVSRVSGIECVGEIDLDPSGKLPRGHKVAAVVGGMGRTHSGSYAEFTCVSVTNAFAVHTDLPWECFAAVPESYATAWTCLFDNLALRGGQVLLVRGATSALGQAAVDIAMGCGAIILASTRSQKKTATLQSLGVHRVFIDTGQLSTSILEVYPEGIDCVLDIVGNTVLKDSLKMLKKGGRLCEVGFLGGGGPVDAFNPLVDLPSGVQLSFFASGLVLGNRDYPLSNIPMQEILNRVAEGVYRAKPARVFPFHLLGEAHSLMESNQANGKIVVVM